MTEDIRNHIFEDVRAMYKDYLNEQGLSQRTVTTSYNTAFYLWRNRGPELFWDIVFAEDFEVRGEKILTELLKLNSTGNIYANVKGYMSHLRKFRQFIQNKEKTAASFTSAKPTEEYSHLNLNVKTDNTESNIHRKKSKRGLPTPTPTEVEYYLELWNTLEDYHFQEDALDRLFFTLCPENNKISDILLKVSVLNDFYSTNIFKVYPVAKHILSLNIDERLRCGDITLVDEIKAVATGGKTKNFYSFATKYCSHHKPLDYPIYDSYVDKVLQHYRKRDKFASFKKDDLKNYTSFKTALEAFRTFYHLEKYNLKELDKYLWQLGKRYFNKF